MDLHQFHTLKKEQYYPKFKMNNKQQKAKKEIEKLISYYNKKKFTLTIEGSKTLLKSYPNNTFLHNIIGSSLKNLGQLKEAKGFFMKSLNLQENNLATINNLANTLRKMSDFKKAEDYYKIALNIDPNHIDTIVNYGSLYYELNDLDKAIDLFKKAINLDSKVFQAQYNLGLAYQSIGFFKEAEKHFLEALKINPKFTAIDKLISRFTKYTKNNLHLKSMIDKMSNSSLDDNSRSNLNFALGKAYEDLGDFENSFKNLEIGNRIKKNLTNYNLKHDIKKFNELINKFKEFIFSKSSNFKYDKKIIFIVGLPRSGTSLVEQIISSHSKVYGGGELKFLNDLILNNFYKNNNLDTFHKLMKDTDLIENIHTEYFKFIRNLSSSSNIITDKAPLNFMWIGFIKILFPNAKVVHCNRNPKDNCLSLYKNIFDEKLDWTYNQSDIFGFYSGYINLMKFWKKKVGDFIYDINYEELVLNPDTEIKKLISFCDLEWEDSCKLFYKNKRPIKTVSISQAREPLFNSSISSFENYKTYLTNLFSNLDKKDI